MSHTHIYQGNVSGSLSLRVCSGAGGGGGRAEEVVNQCLISDIPKI